MMVELKVDQEEHHAGFVLDGAAKKNVEGCAPKQQIDHEQVEQLRRMLKEEAEKEMAAGKDDFCMDHFEEIMDPNSPFTCWRYILHCKEDLSEALELMKSALVWRKENQVNKETPDDFCKEFWHAAPIMITGVDKNDNDVVYVCGRDYRKPDSVFRSTVRKFCSRVFFKWDAEHRHDLRKACIVFDTCETSFRNLDLDFMSWMVRLPQFLPARVANIYVFGIPVIVRPLIKLIISWLPEKISSIVECDSFEELVLKNIELDNLPPEAGGTAREDYRIAPFNVPWREDSKFAGEAMDKIIRDSIGVNLSEEKRERLSEIQREVESNKEVQINI